MYPIQRLARHLQEREAIRAERARHYRKEQELIEEQERQTIQQSLADVQLEYEPPPVLARGSECKSFYFILMGAC